MASTKPVYKMLGVYFKQQMRPRVYFEKLHQKWWATKESNDWLLCAYLLDCDVDAFAHNITKYYRLDSHLPKHYREALILYTHLREHPYLVYPDAVMDADYAENLSFALDFKTFIGIIAPVLMQKGIYKNENKNFNK